MQLDPELELYSLPQRDLVRAVRVVTVARVARAVRVARVVRVRVRVRVRVSWELFSMSRRDLMRDP